MSDSNLDHNINFKICKKCLTPSTRPRIKFNEEGICNSCLFLLGRKKINFKERENELNEICKKFRSKNGDYDCIVPWSGGKDSSAIAYKLKFKYKMNPLLVTFSPLIDTEVGKHNRNELIKLGFDNVFFVPNKTISKYLSKRFFIERGNPKVCWDAGINAIPIKVALEKKINLIFYAENGECFYGGNVLSDDAEKKMHLEDLIENKIGDDPSNWIDDKVSDKDLNPYKLPDHEDLKKSKLEIYYFAYFEKWNINQNFNFISSKMNFLCHKDGRTPGTFTNYDSLDDHVDQVYYYFQLLKFGFGKAVRDASRLIQQSGFDKIKLEKQVEKYDREIPTNDIIKYCDYISISLDEFNDIREKHREKNIWKFKGNDWKLVNEI